jgi:hypothetical protein
MNPLHRDGILRDGIQALPDGPRPESATWASSALSSSKTSRRHSCASRSLSKVLVYQTPLRLI